MKSNEDKPYTKIIELGKILLTPFLDTCLGWQDKVAVRCGLPMRMVADEGEVECDRQ